MDGHRIFESMTHCALSIVVISYNTRELTLECLRSVFRETTGLAYEVILLDNASVDGSADAIEAEFGSRIRLIRSEVNLGFAAGNNAAVCHAKGDWLLLLNPDTVIKNKAINQILAFAQDHPRARIWGGRTVFADGRLNPSSCWGRQTLWSLASQAVGLNVILSRSSLFNSEAIGGWQRDSSRHVDIVSGCFFLIHRDLWQQLDGFDERFFMYGEEADLCLRAKIGFGAQPMVCSNAEIVHHGGASERIRVDKVVRLIRAKRMLVAKHFSWSSRGLGLVLLTLWPVHRYLAHRALFFLGRSSSGAEADAWREVILRYSEWAR